MTSLYSTTLKATFVSFLFLLIGCGGQPISSPVQPQATTIIAAQVFDESLVGQTWLFEGTCEGDVLDPFNKLLAHFEKQPFHATINVEPGPSLTFTKDVPCGYWLLGAKGAELHNFGLQKDSDGGWYNTGGHVILPFGCPWCLPTSDTAQEFTYTVPPPADKTLPRAYQIIPPKGDDQHKLVLDTEYGKTQWRTVAYIENVDTPIYSGPALVSEQTENNCVHEYWYFAPTPVQARTRIGLVQIKAVPIDGCSGLQSTVIAKRTR